MRLLALVALLGCAPKSAPQDALPSPGVVRLLLAPELPPLCVSDGGPDTPKDGRAARQAALVRLQAGDAAGARAALGTVDASPAADVLRAVAALYDGDLRGARALLRDVGVALPADGCVQEALALLAVLDNASGQARVHAADAWRLQPTAPEAGALYAQILQRAGAADEAARVLREVIQVAPTHPLSNLLLARFYLDRGDALLALPLLAHAQAGGLPVGPLQLRAAWGAGDLPAYLRAASAAGLPLGDQGALATAGDPVGAYRALVGLGDGQDTLTLRIDTRVGPLDCELFWRDAPVTVASFVGLARGTIGWVHPDTGAAMAGTPLYDGTVMHRVIPEFMVQMGDPRGDGTGGPGYRFPDEIAPGRRFDRPGLLAMANSGPATNGSQFFITEVRTPHLDGKHTIFGACTEETIQRIAALAREPRDRSDRPMTPVVLEKVTVGAR